MCTPPTAAEVAAPPGYTTMEKVLAWPLKPNRKHTQRMRMAIRLDLIAIGQALPVMCGFMLFGLFPEVWVIFGLVLGFGFLVLDYCWTQSLGRLTWDWTPAEPGATPNDQEIVPAA